MTGPAVRNSRAVQWLLRAFRVAILITLLSGCRGEGHTAEESESEPEPTPSAVNDESSKPDGDNDTPAQASPALPPLDKSRFPRESNILTDPLFARLPANSQQVYGLATNSDGGLGEEELSALLTNLGRLQALPDAELEAVVEAVEGPAGLALLPNGEMVICAVVNETEPVVQLVSALTGAKATPVDGGTVANWKFEGHPWTITAIDQRVYVARAQSQARAEILADSIAGGGGLGELPAFNRAVAATGFGSNGGAWFNVAGMYRRSVAVIEEKLEEMNQAREQGELDNQQDGLGAGLAEHLEHRYFGMQALWSRMDAIAVGFRPDPSRIDLVAVGWWEEDAPKLTPLTALMPIAAGWESPAVVTFAPPRELLAMFATLGLQDVTELDVRRLLKGANLNLDRDILPLLSGQLAIGLRWTFNPALPDFPLLEPAPMVSLQLAEDAPIDKVWDALLEGLAENPSVSLSTDQQMLTIAAGTAAIHVERGDEEVAIWVGPAGRDLSAFKGERTFGTQAAGLHAPLTKFDGMLGQVDVRLNGDRFGRNLFQQDPKDAVCRPNNQRFTVADETARKQYCSLLDDARTMDQTRRQAIQKAGRDLFSSLVLRATLARGESSNTIVAYGAVYPDHASMAELFTRAATEIGALDSAALLETLQAVYKARAALDVERHPQATP